MPPKNTLRDLLLEAGVVAGVLAVAVLLRLAATPWLAGYPFVTLFPAVTALSWWRGVRTGLPGAVIGWLVCTALFVPPVGIAWPVNANDWIGAALFFASAALIVALGEQRRLTHSRAGHTEQAAAVLAAIVQSTDDVVVSKDLNGVIQSWNNAAQRIFGYTAQEAVGKHITLIIPKDRHQEETMIIDRVRRGERVDHFETVRVAKDGHLVNLSITVSPVRDVSGRIVGASKIARDIGRQISDRKQREELLASERAARAQAERLGRVKDDFVATLSHELRTPLSAILGWSQLIRRADRDPADLDQGLEVIERNARAQSQMIEDLLDMSRIDSGKLRLNVQRVNMSAVVEQAIVSAKPAADAKQIRLVQVLDPRTNLVNGDPTRLQQIIWNLLSNAIKFTPKGGRVEVVLRRVNSSIQVAISDTGKGIKKEFLEQIFQRFQQEDVSTTRKFGGLGLGLAIVKHLTELHGGTVSASSQGEGAGATFTVRLPMALLYPVPPSPADVQPVQASAAPMPREYPDLSGMRILVVDDEPDSRALLARILMDCRAEVRTAESVEAGLEAFRSLRPDILLSDIGMPGRDGYDFIRAVRALPQSEGGSTPAAALTALARSEDRTRALVAGFQVHVSKPIEPSELVAVVATLAKMSVKS